MTVVVPLPTAASRGWHGMRAREQASYRPEDWQTWAALGNDDARLVDVTAGSPAWLADLRDGTWVTAIDDTPFEKHAGKIGDVIDVRAQVPGIGPVIRKLVLVAPPAKKSQHVAASRRPAWKLEPPVLPGERVYKHRRAAFLEVAARHPYVKQYVWLLVELLRRDWRKGIIVKHGTIAEAVKRSRRTILRAQSCCQHFGFIRVISGKRARVHNTYEVCWPADTR